ncbi:MAG: sigma-54-dependent Fis family transcriptional regulator [Ignavibacteria bacterium]|nr:sigma-54-dependent Fis family transcriptional regulator [Ignavibacteria bacterium]
MESTSLQDHPVFLVDDERQNLTLLRMWVEKLWKLPVVEFDNPQECLDNLHREPSLIILDIMMPKIDGMEVLRQVRERYPHIPVVMLSAQNNIQVALDAIHIGAYDYLQKPVDRDRLEVVTRNAIRSFELAMELRTTRQRLEEGKLFSSIVSIDPKMKSVFELVRKSANSHVSILIQGESGTGKDLIATALHQLSHRRDKPFIIVNCAAIPSELLESELFGHEKGSFTGADTQKMGRFEAADGGTLFLDEIGTMEFKLQAKVLRAIQQKEFSRVGGLRPIHVEVRIISATNSDLQQMVKDGTFREDLYYRLATFPISIPPLRDRKDDIVLLAEHFLERSIDREQKDIRGFTKEAIIAMTQYNWPGNVRELQSVIERAIILADDHIIGVQNLPEAISAQARKFDATDSLFQLQSANDLLPFELFKKSIIKKAFELCDRNISEVAQRLNISRTTVYRLLEGEDTEGL